MKTLLKEMERNIEAELKVQLTIQELLDRQLDILTRGRSEKLSAVLEAAEDGLRESARLEAERNELLQKIGAELQVPYKTVTLEMIERTVGSDAIALRESGDELKEILERIRESNRRVSLLLRHSVVFIEDLLQAIGGRTVGPPTYTKEGRMEKATTMAAEG